MKVLGSLVVATSFFLLVASLCVGPANSLFCWSNSDSSADAEWEIQECVMTNSDTSCLSQYRLHNGELVPSYFGCHTTDIPCSFNCTATDCGKNAFTCCCSSDLCNEIERVTPSLKEVTRESGATEQTPATLPQTETPPVEDGCQNAGCSHNCIEHKGRPQCYCNGGYILHEDGRTCVDLNECAYNNGGCEGVCHNENGTGYHCSCHSNRILAKDGFHCDNFTGLVCYSQSCNGDGDHCTPATIAECGNTNGAPQHCQATFTANSSGKLEVRLRSCFRGHYTCEKGGCTPIQVNNGPFYHCCCDGHLCNGNITYPLSHTIH